MKVLRITFLLLATLPYLNAQDTFSIVAVDSITGEVGSAGASCLDNIQFPGSGGAYIISDILPGKGAIHTQSYYNATNQANARLKMEEGLSPEEVLLWLKNNDPTGLLGAQTRQYGIADFDDNGSPRAAAFTGTQCLDWKGHHEGVYYAIQGNILLGPEIIDSMQANFLNTSGTLADRLMAALQGANVVGADSRCTNNGTSSLSAFLRVAKPDDDPNNLYLDLNVPSLPAGMEPIDSVQTLYDQWLTTGVQETPSLDLKIYPNPADGFFQIESPENGTLRIYNLQGQQMLEEQINSDGVQRFSPDFNPGIYLLELRMKNGKVRVGKLAWL